MALPFQNFIVNRIDSQALNPYEMPENMMNNYNNDVAISWP
jgi:hypothetical protein